MGFFISLLTCALAIPTALTIAWLLWHALGVMSTTVSLLVLMLLVIHAFREIHYHKSALHVWAQANTGSLTLPTTDGTSHPATANRSPTQTGR